MYCNIVLTLQSDFKVYSCKFLHWSINAWKCRKRHLAYKAPGYMSHQACREFWNQICLEQGLLKLIAYIFLFLRLEVSFLNMIHCTSHDPCMCWQSKKKDGWFLVNLKIFKEKHPRKLSIKRLDKELNWIHLRHFYNYHVGVITQQELVPWRTRMMVSIACKHLRTCSSSD